MVYCERYWVFDLEFAVNSTGTARMIEGKSYAFCLSSGADEKFEGHISIKPTVSERKPLSEILNNSKSYYADFF